VGPQSREERASAPIHLAPLRDSSDDYDSIRVINGVYDPIVPDPDSVVILANELGDPSR
jgi:hypothetical protein